MTKQSQSSNIKVFVRVRPLKQAEAKLETCIQMNKEESGIVMKDKQSNSNFQFSFDRVLDPETNQQEVYETVAKSIVEKGLEGINGTIFAYGQTSSGKTHTCIGPNFNDPQMRGILPRIITHILEEKNTKPPTVQFRMKLSMVEIYNQKIKDLLDSSKDSLKIRSNKNKGIYIENVTEKIVSNEEEAFVLLKKGIESRSVGCTNMNAESSRSHMAFLITIYQNDFVAGQAKTAKITLIDLAGSQKISKTGAQGKLLEEAKQINKSLCTLGKVINALSESKTKNAHIPYRDSKLTRLLQESLGGNSLTSLVVNISPSSFNQSETLSSLRFGYRAKSIENKPKVNKQYTVQELTKMLERAELRIRQQQKLIQGFERKKRVGGYGCFANDMISMQFIADESDSDTEKNKSKNSFGGNSSQQNSINIVNQSAANSQLHKKVSNNKSNPSISEIVQEKQNLLQFQKMTSSKKIHISIIDNQTQSQNQTQERRGILSNNRYSQQQITLRSRLGSFQQNSHLNIRGQSKKLSKVVIKDPMSEQDNSEDAQKSANDQDLIPKIDQLQMLLFEERTKYCDLLSKYTDLRSESSIHNTILERKNNVIENLKRRTKKVQQMLKNCNIQGCEPGQSGQLRTDIV